MRSGLLALGVAAIYYVAAFAVLTLLKVKPTKLFTYSTIPLALGGLVWIAWAIGQNLWGGLIVAIMLAVSVGLAWAVKREFL